MLQQPEFSTLQFSGQSSGFRKNPAGRATFDPKYVRGLFDRIAPRYDLLNHLLSSGIDVLWRRKTIGLLCPHRPSNVLDVATGTGDLAFEAVRQLHPHHVIGIDVAPAMLDIGRAKAVKKGFRSVEFAEGPAEALPFETDSFDALTVGFGVRNFSDLSKGLSEMYRVLRPGSPVIVLEFSRPRSFPVQQLYSLYSKTLLPAVGGFISRDREAYEYLPGTIREFPDGNDFLALLRTAGFHSLKHYPLTFGIATIYYGIK
ncbi:MAG: bifunctional demethylmenaquinone methyltransferase/2-methoxy-6-polyprenyl-1,4-benzoquinol methylase UbiE [Bacteroidota bacterium]